MKYLVIFAHPNIEKSAIGSHLINEVYKWTDATVIDLYNKYKNAKFCTPLDEGFLQEDRALMEKSDAIILQFPFYWYQTPALLKQWLDDVLLFGWAHHSGVIGKKYALEGKSLMLSVTTGGKSQSYTPNGYNMSYITDFFEPFIQTARTLKMPFAKPFITHSDLFNPNETPIQYIKHIKENA
jgi:putative NADPH-quinone reductase